MAINSVVLEKGSNGGIYVSTDLGIFYSNNYYLSQSTPQWKLLGTSLPHIPVSGLEINYAINKLRVATSGRGLWVHDLFCRLI